jgi:hypothetical protein
MDLAVTKESLPKTKLFGVQLESVMEKQKAKLPFLNVPWLVIKCCHFLLEEGIRSEGVFRVPGAHMSIQRLAEAFDNGENPDFRRCLVDDVSGLLKKYLRELPGSILTDGTQEDHLQTAFKQTLEIQDVDERIRKTTELIKQLSHNRRALVKILIHLLYKIKNNEDKTLMNSENLATIFGGMGDIFASKLTSAERTRLTRFMIDCYKEIFLDVDPLMPRPDDLTGSGSKQEGIKVFLSDGTFKSLFTTGAEKCKDFEKKLATKIQQQLNLDTAKYKLYETADGLFRPIGPEEKLLAIYKTGSAILYTDKLKAKEKKKSSSGKKRTTKKSPSMSSRTESESDEPTTPRSESSMKQSRREKGQSMAPVPALQVNAASSTDLTAPITPKTDLLHKAWVFTEIPHESLKASEWDTKKAQPGELRLFVDNQGSCKIKAIVGESSKDFPGVNAKQVFDSTRYFVLCANEDDEGGSYGVGFETREASTRFKDALIALIATEQVSLLAQYDQPHEGETHSEQTPAETHSDTLTTAKTIAKIEPVQLTSRQKYFVGPLNSTDRIENGFYDPGHQIANEPLTSLESYKNQAVDVEMREVILVDEDKDERLMKYLGLSRTLVQQATSFEAKLGTLALFVTTVMGGVSSLFGSALPELSSEALFKNCISGLKKANNSNVVLLGQITHGLLRHRALLFKYLADRQEPVIPVTLARSNSVTTQDEVVWNLVASPQLETHVYIDLMEEIGTLHALESEKVKRLKNIMHKSAGADLSLDKVIANRKIREATMVMFKNLQIIDRQVTFPDLSAEGMSSNVITHELTSSGPFSKVYRASIGPYTIAMKELSAGKSARDEADYAKVVAPRVSVNHPNVATTFGYEYTEGGFRILLEYFAKGSLLDALQRRRSWHQTFSEEQLWYYMNQIAEGLAALHREGLFHGALKSTNVLVEGEGEGEPYPVVKLTDFNFYYKKPTTVFEVNSSWLAPEVINAVNQKEPGNYDPRKADIWSLGMLLTELVNLETPYSNKSNEEKLRNISAGTLPPLLDYKYKEFVEFCCKLQPNDRPSIEDVLKKIEEYIPQFLVQQIAPK